MARVRAFTRATAVVLLLAGCGAGRSVRVADGPTEPSATHATLRRDIARFQRTWRELWQRSFVQRHLTIVNLELLRSDLEFGNVTYEGRRYTSILCSNGWIGETELAAAQANPQGGDGRVDLSQPRLSATERLMATLQQRPVGTAPPDDAALPTTEVQPRPGVPQVLNLWSSRRVRGGLDKGQVCPQWIPEDVGLPLDEGERIDFALPVGVRGLATLARDSLLRRLRAASREAPGDPWIAGQRVRFALDNADLADAADAAATCGTSVGWCRALEGLVLLERGELAAAEQAFAQGDPATALGTRTACADTSAFALLPDGPRQEAHALPCAEQRALEERVWWLADPLWSVAGNPRRLEHHARLTRIVLRAALDEDERFSWRRTGGGDALRETIVRYGWPSHTYWGGWQLDEQLNKGRARVMMEPNGPYTAKEYSPDRTALIASWRALRDPVSVTPSDWELVRPRGRALDAWWPAEHMSLVPRLFPLPEGQLALLRRDRTVRVGVAIDDAVRGLEPDLAAPLRVTVMASSHPGERYVVADSSFAPGETLRAIGDLRADATVLSVEVPGRSAIEVSHRRRSGLVPPATLLSLADSSIAVSDPVFLRLRTALETPPIDPDSALMRMAGSLEFRRDTPLAIYWESYGIPIGDTTEVELRIVRRDETSALRQLGARLGVADARRDSVRIAWREPDPGRTALQVANERTTVARALTVNVGNLVPGRYAVRVLMTRSDGRQASGEREITVQP